MTSSLFKPIKVGNIQLEHRVVYPPLTRLRHDANHVPTAMVEEYYGQRATKGGLMIAEATGISPGAGVIPGAPEIYTKDQIEAWKRVTSTVHKKGGYIFSQLWHGGRFSDPSMLPNNALPVAPSAIPIPVDNIFTGKPFAVPRALEVSEIPGVIQEYVQAAKYALEAGFDGVELHGANGYLIDQFLNSSSNSRTDMYGGSAENRARFGLEVLKAVVDAVGAPFVAIRFSPWSEYFGIYDDTPYETWGYIVAEIQKRHPDLAYIHMVGPRDDFARTTQNDTVNSLGPICASWKGPLIVAGGYSTNIESVKEAADKSGALIAIGRVFIANPDLVFKLKNNVALTKYDRNTFYTNDAIGYTDYPFYQESQA